MNFDLLRCAACQAPFNKTSQPVRFYKGGKVHHGYCTNCIPPNFKKHQTLQYLKEILEQPNLFYSRNGWKVSGLLKPLKCPNCQVTFTHNGEFDPVLMWGSYHLLCGGCYKKLGELQSNCAVCGRRCGKSGDPMPIVAEYIKACHRLTREDCIQCKKTFAIDQLFNCVDCKLTACSLCIVRKHRTHELVDLGAVKLAEMESTSTTQLVDQFEGLNKMVVHVHAEMAAGALAFIKAIQDGLRMVGQQTEHRKGASICEELNNKMRLFEQKFENYLPNARIYDEDLKKLKEAVDEFTLPFKPE